MHALRTTCGAVLKASVAFCIAPVLAAQAATIELPAGDAFEPTLREVLVNNIYHDHEVLEIVLPEGHYLLSRSITVDGKNLVIRGRGTENTILDFKHSQDGSEGVLVRGQNILVSDFAIKNAEGDGIKVNRSQHVTLRRLNVSWEYPPGTIADHYGGYAIYPVMSQYIIVEDCEASGAADAGIYIGQSYDVILRNNRMHHNSIGLEAENSQRVDMLNNHTYNNSVGVVLLAIPDIPEKILSHVRIIGNRIEENNLPHLGVPNAVVADLPLGVGILLVGPDYTEIRDNVVNNHQTTGVLLVHHDIIGVDEDPDFEGTPDGVFITNNEFNESGWDPTGGISAISKFLIKVVAIRINGLNPNMPDIVWDGVTTDETPKDRDRLCISGNKENTSFANFNWPKKLLRIKRSLDDHACVHPHLPPVEWEGGPQ